LAGRANRLRAWLAASAVLLAVACNRGPAAPGAASNSAGAEKSTTASTSAAAPAAAPQIPASEAAPPADQTGGFDGAKAYDHVAKLVAIGPRTPASEGIHRAQEYIRGELQGFGCAVEDEDFHAQTPAGEIPMKNILAKIPGSGGGIILLMTHYDTLSSVKNFVGAEDSGSSTGLMLEMARLLCPKKGANAVWIAFLDGEEAFVDWNTNEDHTYGSRELAARMALSGDLRRVKAVILTDMIGQKNVRIPRDSNSTKWLVDLVWKTAERLGYKNTFVNSEDPVDDDHSPFLHRNVPAVDLIDLEDFRAAGYWHTPQDTLDKVSPKSLAIVGHVVLASVDEIQKTRH
jgi:glutaminyl-peptide cyclotransferase